MGTFVSACLRELDSWVSFIQFIKFCIFHKYLFFEYSVKF